MRTNFSWPLHREDCVRRHRIDGLRAPLAYASPHCFSSYCRSDELGLHGMLLRIASSIKIGLIYIRTLSCRVRKPSFKYGRALFRLPIAKTNRPPKVPNERTLSIIYRRTDRIFVRHLTPRSFKRPKYSCSHCHCCYYQSATRPLLHVATAHPYNITANAPLSTRCNPFNILDIHMH